MFLYIELLKIKLYFHHIDYRILNTLNTFWKSCADCCETSEKIIKKHDWFIECKRGKREFTNIDYLRHHILFIYSTEHDFLEINSLIRELTVKLTVERGLLWLHASSFSLENKVFVIVGNKGNGKTTWMVLASKYLNARFICNDQLPIQVINGKPYTKKWRPDIKINQDTLDILDEKIKKNVDRYMLFEDKENDDMFDFDGYRKLTGQSLAPISRQISWDFKFVNTQLKRVTNVILLNHNVNEFAATNLMDEFNTIKQDKECIVPSKALKWNENFEYWNNRLTKLFIEKKNLDEENNIIKMFSDSVTSNIVNNKHMRVTDVIDLIRKVSHDDILNK